MRISNYRVGFWIIATIFSLLLFSCIGVRSSIAGLNELADNEILIVGRIEIVPPIGEKEQDLDFFYTNYYKNKIYFIIGDRIFNNIKDLGMDAYDYAAMSDQGKDFYIKTTRSNPLYYSFAWVQMQVNPDDKMYFPGGWQYEILPEDKAVYLGTICYHRDVYNTITKVELIDEYKRVNAKFIEKYGNQIELRRVKFKKTEEVSVH